MLQFLEVIQATPLELFTFESVPHKTSYSILADFNTKKWRSILTMHINIQYFIKDTEAEILIKKGHFTIEYRVWPGDMDIKSRELYLGLEAIGEIMDTHLFLQYRDRHGIGHSYRVEYPSYNDVRDQLIHCSTWFNEKMKQ